MRINLLPPEVRRARGEAATIRRIRLFGLLALLLLGGLYGIRSAEVIYLRGDLDELRAQQAAGEVERQQLGEVAIARDAVVASQTLGAQLLRGEVSWSQQLLRLSQAVPQGFTFTSVTGSATPDGVGGLVGSVTFSAVSRDFVPAREWLLRIAAQEGWTNGWVSSITSGDNGFAVSGSYDLTAASLSPRGGGPA